MPRLLIAGCGDIGRTLLSLLEECYEVYGLRRNPPTDTEDDIQWIKADLMDPSSLSKIPSVDYVVYTATPSGRGEQAYRDAYYEGLKNLVSVLDSSTLKRFFFVSSTSVYGQRAGEWVDEKSETSPSGFSGQTILAAESFILDQQFAATVVRFAGIYGPGRLRMIKKIQAGDAEIQFDPPSYSNRIHRDDCAGILRFLIERVDGGGCIERCYLGVDDEPTSAWEFANWLADRLGVSSPKTKPTDPNASQNKRCSNKLIKKAGYEFQYPTFKVGYDELIRTLETGC